MALRISRALLATSLAVLAHSCGTSTGPDGRPRPGPTGTLTGAATQLSLDATGGSLTSPDGRLTVTVPPGAVATAVVFTIDEITNTAPGGIGVAYRLGPAGSRFPVPLGLTFRAGAAGAPVSALAVATQDQVGFWLRPAGVVRDAAAATVSTQTAHFSDWALVTAVTARDLHGTFTLDSTIADSTPFTATGQSTLDYAGDGPDRSYYLQWGTLSLPALVAWGAESCLPVAQAVDLRTNIAELRPAAGKFDWGISGHWDLDCAPLGGPTTRRSILTAFDTAGVSWSGCTRGYVGTPLLGQDRIAGTYAIDCGARGRLTATWDFTSQTCGGTCSGNPDPVCHQGIVDCASGAAVCVDGAERPNGTTCSDGNACTAGDSCQAGVCTAGAPVVCTALDACHDAGTCDPASGLCSSPARPDGASCSDGNACTAGDTCQAGVCTAGTPVVCTALDACHLAGSCDPATGCTSPAAPDGTACSDGSACTVGDACQAGVCTAGAPVACTALDACHDAGTCDPATGLCSTPAKADGASCTDGDACTVGDTCQAGACTAGAPAVCTALDACHLAGACDPATGCSNPVAPDGTACGTGLVCTGGVCGP